MSSHYHTAIIVMSYPRCDVTCVEEVIGASKRLDHNLGSLCDSSRRDFPALTAIGNYSGTENSSRISTKPASSH
jgi:hypothetical protein